MVIVGRKPAHAFDRKKNLILDLYPTKYSDANITHFSELLEKHENIKVSPSTIRSILMKELFYLLRLSVLQERVKNQPKRTKKNGKFKKRDC